MNCKIYKICNDILRILCYNKDEQKRGLLVSTANRIEARTWTCPHCQSKHDRDINASINILSKGIEILTKDGTHPDSLFMLGSLDPSSKKPPLL